MIDFIAKLTQWVGQNIDFPAVVMLMLIVMGMFVMFKTQSSKTNSFDFADMLRDESGKPSAFRLGIFVSMAVTSWYMMYTTIHNQGPVDTYQFLIYLGVWSGAKIVEKGLEIWGTRGQPTIIERTTASQDADGNKQLESTTKSIPQQ